MFQIIQRDKLILIILYFYKTNLMIYLIFCSHAIVITFIQRLKVKLSAWIISLMNAMSADIGIIRILSGTIF